MDMGAALGAGFVVDPVEACCPADPGEFLQRHFFTCEIDAASFLVQGFGAVNFPAWSIGILDFERRITR